jgi:hypothetical protein
MMLLIAVHAESQPLPPPTFSAFASLPQRPNMPSHVKNFCTNKYVQDTFTGLVIVSLIGFVVWGATQMGQKKNDPAVAAVPTAKVTMHSTSTVWYTTMEEVPTTQTQGTTLATVFVATTI